MHQEDLKDGASLVYEVDRFAVWRQAAAYADRLLRGADAGDRPFVQPSRIVFGINLKTAQALGLTIPPDLVAGADEVIE